MVVLVFAIAMFVVVIFLGVASEKGWLKLPDDPEVTNLIAMAGVPVLFASLFVIILFPLKIFTLIAEYGIWYFLAALALIGGLILVMFTLGYGYFWLRRKRGNSTIQELKLGE